MWSMDQWNTSYLVEEVEQTLWNKIVACPLGAALLVLKDCLTTSVTLNGIEENMVWYCYRANVILNLLLMKTNKGTEKMASPPGAVP